jgi:hypothetical protein
LTCEIDWQHVLRRIKKGSSSAGGSPRPGPAFWARSRGRRASKRWRKMPRWASRSDQRRIQRDFGVEQL